MLAVHVLGPGFGESIVIELPGGEVGVIDSFRARHTQPPALEFLRALRPELTSLRFVALTHPHADHCMGAHAYLESYHVQEVWLFHSFLEEACLGFFKAMHDKKSKDAVEAALELPAGSVWLDALKLRKAIKEQDGAIRKRFLRADQEVGLGAGRVKARFLTPNDQGVWRYEEILANAVTSLVGDGPTLDPDWDPGGLPHHQASGVILLEYGQTRLLFMADAEDLSWRDLIEEQNASGLPKANFIKASHHGSANGFNATIYDWAADKNTVVVMTPFNRHRRPLPTGAGVDLVRLYVKELYCTNCVEARKASGLAWQFMTPRATPSPALPLEWAVDCRDDSRRLSLLADQQVTHPYVAGTISIPPRWHHACQKHPELIQLLCPELRNLKVVGPRPRLNDEFRVSLTYDDGGNVLDQYVGWGVGRLPGL